MSKHLVYYKGTPYKNKKVLFSAFNINYRTAMSKISKLGYELDEVIEEEKVPRYFIDGKEFYNMREVSEHTGFTEKALYKYKEKGMTLQNHINYTRNRLAKMSK